MADMLTAATALAHGLTLVTRNVRDFESCGVSLLDPFDAVNVGAGPWLHPNR
jgi:toxin FitB